MLCLQIEKREGHGKRPAPKSQGNEHQLHQINEVHKGRPFCSILFWNGIPSLHKISRLSTTVLKRLWPKILFSWPKDIHIKSGMQVWLSQCPFVPWRRAPEFSLEVIVLLAKCITFDSQVQIYTQRKEPIPAYRFLAFKSMLLPLAPKSPFLLHLLWERGDTVYSSKWWNANNTISPFWRTG